LHSPLPRHCSDWSSLITRCYEISVPARERSGRENHKIKVAQTPEDVGGSPEFTIHETGGHQRQRRMDLTPKVLEWLFSFREKLFLLNLEASLTGLPSGIAREFAGIAFRNMIAR
jgi:hypothetical protein